MQARRAAAWGLLLLAAGAAAMPLGAVGGTGGTGGPEGTAGPAGTGDPGAGRLVVGLRHDAMPREGDTLHGHRVAAVLPALDAAVLQVPDVAAARRDLEGRPDVRYAEPDATATALATPNDPRYPDQYAPRAMGFPAAWDTAGYGAASVKVALIDSGIDRAHPDLQGGRVLAGYDYVHHDATPEDDCGHGTAVAGIVGAATNNGAGLAGLAQATLLPLKALARDPATGACTGSMADVARAVTDATDQGARVLVLSLATSGSDATTAAALQYATDHGALVVAGAGNDGRLGVRYPASDPNAIAVGAVDASKAVASYSNRGPQLDVVAPGTGVLVLRPGSAYATTSGTSYAAPQAAGALALAWSCAPGLDRATLRAALEATAEDLGAAGRDDTYGNGLVRADRLVGRVCLGAAPPPVANGTWAPAFAVASGSNEWWVEVRVQSSQVARVEATVDGVAHDLAKRDWGAWASSFHVLKGTPITFKATDTAGHYATFGPIPWLGEPGTFTVTFTPKGIGNAWWVEVALSASEPVAKVTANVGGTSYELPKTDWGTWAKSLHAPAGTPVTFTATSAQGATVQSARYTW